MHYETNRVYAVEQRVIRDCPDCGHRAESSFEVAAFDQRHPDIGFPIPQGEVVRHNWTQCRHCGHVSVS